MDALLESKISEFVAFIEKQKAQDIAQLRLSFYERRRRQAGWFMLQQEERLYWEQWCVNVAVVQPGPFTQDHTSLAYTDGERGRTHAGALFVCTTLYANTPAPIIPQASRQA